MRDYDKIPLRNLIRAKNMRREMTAAEKLLWYQLRSSRIGTKFRRQHAVGIYIVDFVSLEHMLIIEVDGATHCSAKELEGDAIRSRALELLGFRILRFTNQEVLRAMNSVVNSIANELQHD